MMMWLKNVFFIGLFSLVVNLSAQEVWDSNLIVFQKPTGSLPTDPAAQDRITSNVWLTRDFTRGLFNIVQEPSYVSNQSPDDTQWAFSGLNGNPSTNVNAANYQNLTFSSWETALGGPGQILGNIVGRAGVLHLLVEDIYIDIQFSEWGSSGNGGFTYTRATSSASTPTVKAPLPIGMSVIFLLLVSWFSYRYFKK